MVTRILVFLVGLVALCFLNSVLGAATEHNDLLYALTLLFSLVSGMAYGFVGFRYVVGNAR